MKEKNMLFSSALIMLKDGKTITRYAWRKGRANDTAILSIANNTIMYNNTEWKPNPTDLLAEDWEFINEFHTSKLG
jgi:hypothetical protein